jgi:hypothetical protein
VHQTRQLAPTLKTFPTLLGLAASFQSSIQEMAGSRLRQIAMLPVSSRAGFIFRGRHRARNERWICSGSQKKRKAFAPIRARACVMFEYGEDTVEVKAEGRAVIIDDVLATGETSVRLLK